MKDVGSTGSGVGNATAKYVVLVLLSLGIAAGHAAEPQTLKEGVWVCTTPEAYDQAIAAERQAKDLPTLQQRLLDQKLWRKRL